MKLLIVIVNFNSADLAIDCLRSLATQRADLLGDEGKVVITDNASTDDSVARIGTAIANETAQYAREEWSVVINGRRVFVTPDRVLRDAHGIVRVQRIRTGRKTKSEASKPIYALLQRGAREKYPRERVTVETFYLASGERMAAGTGDEGKHIALYADAIAGIERGDLHAEPEARRCPNCPYYFVCGS